MGLKIFDCFSYLNILISVIFLLEPLKALVGRADNKSVSLWYKSSMLQKLYVFAKLFNRMISNIYINI